MRCQWCPTISTEHRSEHGEQVSTTPDFGISGTCLNWREWVQTAMRIHPRSTRCCSPCASSGEPTPVSVDYIRQKDPCYFFLVRELEQTTTISSVCFAGKTMNGFKWLPPARKIRLHLLSWQTLFLVRSTQQTAWVEVRLQNLISKWHSALITEVKKKKKVQNNIFLKGMCTCLDHRSLLTRTVKTQISYLVALFFNRPLVPTTTLKKN